MSLVLPPPPAELASLSEHLAPRQLLTLIELYGGTSLYIPKVPATKSPLVSALGPDAALSLARWKGGEYIKVPIARHWRVRCLRAEGLSYRQIALRLQISEDAVWRHLNAARLTESKQLDLFG